MKKSIRQMLTRFVFLLALAVGQTAWAAMAPEVEQAIHELQTDWAIANYQIPKNRQDEAFEQLTAQAENLVQAHPESAEARVWEAIIVSSHAGATGGLSALGKVKKARELLQKAELMDPDVLEGSVYTSLGSLYYKVPGWPIGFGDDKLAEMYLQKALTVNPTGIDPNYFYGDFLLNQGRYRDAAVYLKKALQAPDRPGRSVADQGRREEARRALQQVQAKVGNIAQSGIAQSGRK